VLYWHDATIVLSFIYKFNYLSTNNSKVGGLLVIPTSDKTSFYHGHVSPSSPPLFSICDYSPSNADHIEDIPMSLSGSSPSSEDDKPIQPKVNIKKKNYDATKKFQEKWLQNSHGQNCL
jgi:hypothetical protein